MTGSGKSSLQAGIDNEFVIEIKDDLEFLETDLLTMEEQGSRVDDELINHAFRAIHSIKGGAGFCTLSDLGSLSHSMENVLMHLRDGRLKPSSVVVDVLLAGLDKMKVMVDSLESGEIPVYQNEIKALEDVLILDTVSKIADEVEAEPEIEPEIEPENKTGDKIVAEVDFEAPSYALVSEVDRLHAKNNLPVISFADRQYPIDAQVFAKALQEGQKVYAVRIIPKQDLIAKNRTIMDLFNDIENAGGLLFCDKDIANDSASNQAFSEPFDLVISTILDRDFLVEVLEIPEERIRELKAQDEDDTREQSDLKLIKLDSHEDSSGLVEPFVHVPGDTENFEDTKALLSEITEKDSFPEKVSAADSGNPISDKKSAASSGNSMAAETIRVNVDLITRLMNMAGELVLSRNRLRSLVEPHARENPAINTVIQNLDMVTSEIQEDIMRIRMQPVNKLLGRFQRIVRDMARTNSKKIDYVVQGEGVELDRTVLEGLSNPLTHLMRNAVDHGIELPRDRAAAGKPEMGTIFVKASHQGGHVHITIQDNGRGMVPDAIAEKAVEKGIIKAFDTREMSKQEKINLIFRPGFSTSDSVTDLSGRGVGMDVVRTNITLLRGHINIDSVPGEGTTVRIIIPLTLAIVSALIVGTGRLRFAIPQVNVSEVVYLADGDLKNRLENLGGSAVMRLRKTLLPVIRLRTLLNMETCYMDRSTGRETEERRMTLADRRITQNRENKDGRIDYSIRGEDRRNNKWGAVYVVVLKTGLNRFGLCLEELFDNEEIVVKPLSDHIKDCRCFSGATILGDGRVVMILDTPGMAAHAGLQFEAINAEEGRRKASEGALQNQNLIRVIIFSSAEEEYFALPLDRVARLEALVPRKIYRFGDRRIMEYNGLSLPLFSLDEFIQVNPCEFKKEGLHVIIPKESKVKAGIVISSIIDTVELEFTFDDTFVDGADGADGIYGSTFFEDKFVQFLDMDKIILMMGKKMTEFCIAQDREETINGVG